jgi:hypothetical protein
MPVPLIAAVLLTFEFADPLITAGLAPRCQTSFSNGLVACIKFVRRTDIPVWMVFRGGNPLLVAGLNFSKLEG